MPSPKERALAELRRLADGEVPEDQAALRSVLEDEARRAAANAVSAAVAATNIRRGRGAPIWPPPGLLPPPV